jgi:hypothetical protein
MTFDLVQSQSDRAFTIFFQGRGAEEQRSRGAEEQRSRRSVGVGGAEEQGRNGVGEKRMGKWSDRRTR